MLGGPRGEAADGSGLADKPYAAYSLMGARCKAQLLRHNVPHTPSRRYLGGKVVLPPPCQTQEGTWGDGRLQQRWTHIAVRIASAMTYLEPPKTKTNLVLEC